MVQTNHAGASETVTEQFWQSVANRIRGIESDRQGCHRVEISKETLPVADAYETTVGGQSALLLPIPASQVESLHVGTGDIIGVRVRNVKLSAKVASSERKGGILTVRLTEPELIDSRATWNIEGSPTTEHMEIMGGL